MRRVTSLAACLLASLSVSCGSAPAPAPAPAAAPAPAPSPQASCDPIGALRFVCGPDGPEDLVAVPRTPWLISSAYNGAGGIYVVDTATNTSTKLFPAATAAERPDTSAYASCP